MRRAPGQPFAGTVRAPGHTAVQRELYRLGFDPVLKPEELPWSEAPAIQPDVAAERTLLRDADVHVLVHPFRLNAPPAIMKGYLERVFGFGFGYGAGGHSDNPFHTGCQLLSFTSSGAPLAWLQKTGAFDAVRTLFDTAPQ